MAPPDPLSVASVICSRIFRADKNRSGGAIFPGCPCIDAISPLAYSFFMAYPRSLAEKELSDSSRL